VEIVAEATLRKWHKKVGDAVARDENLIDIETDKVVPGIARAGGRRSSRQIVKLRRQLVVAGELIAVMIPRASAESQFDGSLGRCRIPQTRRAGSIENCSRRGDARRCQADGG